MNKIIKFNEIKNDSFFIEFSIKKEIKLKRCFKKEKNKGYVCFIGKGEGWHIFSVEEDNIYQCISNVVAKNLFLLLIKKNRFIFTETIKKIEKLKLLIYQNSITFGKEIIDLKFEIMEYKNIITNLEVDNLFLNQEINKIKKKED